MARLLHIDTGRSWRGGQRQCALLCRNLAALGHEVHLICARGRPLHHEMRDGPVAVHTVSAPGEANAFALMQVAMLLRSIGPDLVAAHDAHALGLVAMARKVVMSATPLVCHRRVDVPPRSDALSRWKLRAPALFICVSRAVADVLVSSGVPREKTRVVYSGVPARNRVADAKASLCAELKIAQPAHLIGNVSGLVVHKGHALLLRAFAQLAPELSNTHLVIVGSGPLDLALRDEAAQLGIASHTHFMGERRDIAGLLSAFDLFVAASITEGLNTSILDAFSLALPVVATRAGGIPEIVIEGETGWLAEPGDPQSLAQTIERALAEPDRAKLLGAEASRRFAERFTDRAMASATWECYRALLARG